MVQVNPLHTKRLRELTGNSPGKTDEKDPKVIADIVKSFGKLVKSKETRS